MCKETGILCYFIQATGLLILQERREAQALVYFRACPWEGRGQGPPKPALHCLPLPAWTLTVALHGRALDTVCAEDVHVHQLGVTHKLNVIWPTLCSASTVRPLSSCSSLRTDGWKGGDS